MSDKASQLADAVEAAVADSPYVVTRTDQGFDLTINLADAKWYGVLDKAGLKYDHTYRVTVDGDHFKILQTWKRVEWAAGVPTSFEVEGGSGRFIELGYQKSWAFDEHGKFTKVVDYNFKSQEGLKLIRELAEPIGLSERRPMEMNLAMVFALIAIIGAVATLIAVPLVFLLG
jgi:hypothetical protein